MPVVRVNVELTDDHYRSLRDEAERRGVTLESLVEQMTQNLVLELEEEQQAGGDHPIWIP